MTFSEQKHGNAPKRNKGFNPDMRKVSDEEFKSRMKVLIETHSNFMFNYVVEELNKLHRGNVEDISKALATMGTGVLGSFLTMAKRPDSDLPAFGVWIQAGKVCQDAANEMAGNEMAKSLGLDPDTVQVLFV
jgi:hypothetical protein